MVKKIKNILVTGGAGFIGSNTADLLISNEYKVTVLDNLSSGSRKNINKKARFIISDILDINKHLKKLRDIDAVMHFAAQISVTNSMKNPINDANSNINGTLKILEFCRKNDIAKLVFASSCAVYGLHPALPVNEKFNELPSNPYAVSKRSAELYLDIYRKTYGMDCVSLRYANVYGPRQNYLGEAGVVAIFINGLLRNRKPLIFGDGHQTRDFVYVMDAAEANLRALTTRTHSANINIGTGTQTSVIELLNKLKRLMGKGNINPIYKNARNGEARFSSLDIWLAGKEIGWKPKISFEEGLKNTISWFKNQSP